MQIPTTKKTTEAFNPNSLFELFAIKIFYTYTFNLPSNESVEVSWPSGAA